MTFLRVEYNHLRSPHDPLKSIRFTPKDVYRRQSMMGMFEKQSSVSLCFIDDAMIFTYAKTRDNFILKKIRMFAVYNTHHVFSVLF